MSEKYITKIVNNIDLDHDFNIGDNIFNFCEHNL